MRSLQVLASGTIATTATAQTVVVPFTALRTKVGGFLTNLEAISLRLTKTVTSIVRPYAGSITIRDSDEVLFAAPMSEVLAQSRERGEAISAQLGAVTAIDTTLLVWRPGYGSDEADCQQAAGLFVGGDVTFVTAVDAAASQTIQWELVAHLALGNELRIPARAITRVLGASAREQAGQFKIARVRDQSFSAAASYSIETGQREVFTAVTGATLLRMEDTALGPAGDPVVLTAVAQTTLASPNFIRCACSGKSGTELPPLSKLPDSDGVLRMTAGFVGAPLTTVIYPRSAAETRAKVEAAAQRAGISVPDVLKIKSRFDSEFKASALAPYMPVTAKAA